MADDQIGRYEWVVACEGGTKCIGKTTSIWRHSSRSEQHDILRQRSEKVGKDGDYFYTVTAGQWAARIHHLGTYSGTHGMTYDTRRDVCSSSAKPHRLALDISCSYSCTNRNHDDPLLQERSTYALEQLVCRSVTAILCTSYEPK